VSDVSNCAEGCEARERFSDGRNCAQAVIGSLSGAPGMPTVPETLGAGFTTGIGGSGCVCGALAGGVAMLGEYAGTLGLEAVATRLLAEELAAKLHGRFKTRFGTACCRVIKRGQVPGSDEWLSGCAELTEATVRMIADIVSEHGGSARRSRWAIADVLSTARRTALSVLAGGAVAALLASAAPTGTAGAAFAIATVGIGVAAVVFELGGTLSRRLGRWLRTAGGVAAGAAGVAVLVAPTASGAHLGVLLAPDAVVVIARVLLVGAALVVAATGAFGLKRYR
jgi:C_GCAxxG_C_C family probable redox protein